MVPPEGSTPSHPPPHHRLVPCPRRPRSSLRSCRSGWARTPRRQAASRRLHWPTMPSGPWPWPSTRPQPSWSRRDCAWRTSTTTIRTSPMRSTGPSTPLPSRASRCVAHTLNPCVSSSPRQGLPCPQLLRLQGHGEGALKASLKGGPMSYPKPSPNTPPGRWSCHLTGPRHPSPSHPTGTRCLRRQRLPHGLDAHRAAAR